MKGIESLNSTIYFGKDSYQSLEDIINCKDYSSIFLLTDSNTFKHCRPILWERLSARFSCKELRIPAGENHKTIETCTQLWRQLSDEDADRKSLLINLGGGVVTDLGGFVACTFKRGIDYINIPTTLLSMVDASVGGKTGVDLGGLKNHIGVIQEPKIVIVDTLYLETLPYEEKRSGLAEMLKHVLISRSDIWEILKDLPLEEIISEKNIYTSVEIKNTVVSQDLYEKGLRKTLNFGHTLGHAIETYFLNHPNKKRLPHGEAVAIGSILAAYISHKFLGLDQVALASIKETFKRFFPETIFEANDIVQIISLLKYDKKNSHGDINFVLLESIGKPIWDCHVDEQTIINSFAFYQE